MLVKSRMNNAEIDMKYIYSQVLLAVLEVGQLAVLAEPVVVDRSSRITARHSKLMLVKARIRRKG